MWPLRRKAKDDNWQSRWISKDALQGKIIELSAEADGLKDFLEAAHPGFKIKAKTYVDLFKEISEGRAQLHTSGQNHDHEYHFYQFEFTPRHSQPFSCWLPVSRKEAYKAPAQTARNAALEPIFKFGAMDWGNRLEVLLKHPELGPVARQRKSAYQNSFDKNAQYESLNDDIACLQEAINILDDFQDEKSWTTETLCRKAAIPKKLLERPKDYKSFAARFTAAGCELANEQFLPLLAAQPQDDLVRMISTINHELDNYRRDLKAGLFTKDSEQALRAYIQSSYDMLAIAHPHLTLHELRDVVAKTSRKNGEAWDSLFSNKRRGIANRSTPDRAKP
ncbi:MAG TPA: hypothetical protein DIS76_02105 [Rhodospirillaceae bacterium]|nr:hypothetical protein [Rhodospirillaceae bacterium]